MIPTEMADELTELFADFSNQEGVQETVIPGLGCVKASAIGQSMPSVYNPSFCLIVSGAKELRIGDRVLTYGGGDFLIASIDMPVSGCVIRADRQTPYLCIKLDLDIAILGELMASMIAGEAPVRPSGIVIGKVDSDLADAMLRLCRLMQAAEDVEPLAPLISREIHYRLLKCPQGAEIASLTVKGTLLQRIASAVQLLKKEYDKTISIETMAAMANMSISSFHHHFKSLTGVSPLQYQKRLRLNQARHIMMAEGLTAAGAAYRVGYESPAQFSREYARLFGTPPAKDMKRFQVA